jgi:hypothetical protein
MANVVPLMPRFRSLFQGLDTAFGTGAGRWIKRAPRADDWVEHLEGRGPGMGIAPLRPDNTVLFAAIDLDEPDFEAAKEMQQYIPGPSFIERSRSGNAHVWVFFDDPIEAWIPMAILREATVAAGKEHVEIFPKNHDFSNVRLGNYINLPYHGAERPILGEQGNLELDEFVNAALVNPNSADRWRKRADWLMLEAPEKRERTTEFGTQPNLHMCAEYVIEHAEDNPVMPGHRAVVFFNLAKALTNWELVDHDEALALMRTVNDASTAPISMLELKRILGNAERGQFTSTGCDDPVFAPYAHPDCKIANA